MNDLELEIILNLWSDTTICWLYLEYSQVIFCWREVMMIVERKLEPNYNTKTVIVQLAWFWQALNNNQYFTPLQCSENISLLIVLKSYVGTKIFLCLTREWR